MKKPVVIKIGGAILDGYNQGNTSALTALLKVIASLKEQPVVIVHGGGCVMKCWPKPDLLPRRSTVYG